MQTWAVGARRAFMLMNEARTKGAVYKNQVKVTVCQSKTLWINELISVLENGKLVAALYSDESVAGLKTHWILRMKSATGPTDPKIKNKREFAGFKLKVGWHKNLLTLVIQSGRMVSREKNDHSDWNSTSTENDLVIPTLVREKTTKRSR